MKAKISLPALLIQPTNLPQVLQVEFLPIKVESDLMDGHFLQISKVLQIRLCRIWQIELTLDEEKLGIITLNGSLTSPHRLIQITPEFEKDTSSRIRLLLIR